MAVGALLLRSGDQLATAPDGPFRMAFVLLAVLLLVPVVEALRLPGAAGSAVTGRG